MLKVLLVYEIYDWLRNLNCLRTKLDFTEVPQALEWEQRLSQRCLYFKSSTKLCVYVSCVMCHISHVTCYVSYVTCHLSHVTLFFIYIFFTTKKVVDLVIGGSVINGADPV